MKKALLYHWNEKELKEMISRLKKCGVEVEGASTFDKAPEWVNNSQCVAIIISLIRLPSHGRHTADYFMNTARFRSIPLVFINGDAEKTAIIQKAYPAARFCDEHELSTVLGRLVK